VAYLAIISVAFVLVWALLTACSATYCGWRVLDRRLEKEPIATTLPDQVFGLSAMLLGIFVFSWLPFCCGAVAHQWLVGRTVSSEIFYQVPFALLPFIVAAGVIGSGARVCAVVRWMPWICRGWENVFDDDAWQRFFGGCSLLTGVVSICFAFLVTVAELVPLFR